MGGSKDANHLSNLALLCGTGTTGCHGWITAHPDEAYADGWAVRRNSLDLPSEVPIRLLSGALIALHDDGTRQLIIREASA